MKRFAIITLALAIMVPGAFAQKVRVDYNESHDFSVYRTYAWKGCAATNNDTLVNTGFTTSRIRSAVDNELTLKEMTKVDANANPDVLFTCRVGNKEKTEVWGTSSWGPGWGGGYWGRYGGWGGGWGHSTVNTTHYTEGAYVVDMIDAKSGDLVWRAHSTMRVNHNRKDAKKIQKMARRAFKKFPAGPTVTASNLRPDYAIRPGHAMRGEELSS